MNRSLAAYRIAYDTVMSLGSLLNLSGDQLKRIARHEGNHARLRATQGLTAEGIYADINRQQDCIINDMLRQHGVWTPDEFAIFPTPRAWEALSTQGDNMTKVTLKNPCAQNDRKAFGCFAPGEWFQGYSDTIFVKTGPGSAMRVYGLKAGQLKDFDADDMVRPIKEVGLTVTY